MDDATLPGFVPLKLIGQVCRVGAHEKAVHLGENQDLFLRPVPANRRRSYQCWNGAAANAPKNSNIGWYGLRDRLTRDPVRVGRCPTPTGLGFENALLR